MMLKRAIAAPFKSFNKNSMKKTDFTFFFAFDKRWISGEQANELLKIGLKENLLKEEGNQISPTFDISEIDIPKGYKPPADIFGTKTATAYEELLHEIAEKTNRGADIVEKEIQALIRDSFDGNLTKEAAAVIIARRYKVGFEDKLERFKSEHGNANNTD